MSCFLTAFRPLSTLRGSSHVVIAREDDRVVGFINALTDGVPSDFILLLEVRPDSRRQAWRNGAALQLPAP